MEIGVGERAMREREEMIYSWEVPISEHDHSAHLVTEGEKKGLAEKLCKSRDVYFVNREFSITVGRGYEKKCLACLRLSMKHRDRVVIVKEPFACGWPLTIRDVKLRRDFNGTRTRGQVLEDRQRMLARSRAEG